MIPTRLDIPPGTWRDKKGDILKKIIDLIPKQKIELLTFNREEMIRAYKNQKEDTILLNIKVRNMKLRALDESSLNEKIIRLLSSKMAHVSNYARSFQPGKKTAQTCISIDVGNEQD